MVSNRFSRGFTLVELLVVIAIIGILIGMLLPAVQSVRSAARRISCSNRLRQMALASLNYESAHSRFPAGQMHTEGINQADPNSPGWGWRTHILPFMEQSALDNMIDVNLVMDHPAHNQLLATVIPTFLCPSDPELNNALHQVTPTLFLSGSNYLGNGGSFEWSFVPHLGSRYNGVLTRTKDFSHLGWKIADLSDGTSTTFFAGETIKYGFLWDPATFGYAMNGIKASVTLSQVRTGHGQFNPPVTASDEIKRNSYASNHEAGANFVLCDGSTHFISDAVEHNMLTYEAWLANSGSLGVYQRLFSRNDGLIPGEY